MEGIDLERLTTLQQKMVQMELSALICRLPENVVYLTEYWPHHGISFVVFPQNGKAKLFVPEVEAEYTDLDWADVTTFGWGLLKDGDLYGIYNHFLQAQQPATSAIRAGASFTDPDTAARKVLEAAGLSKYFVHITGHGVGRRYHEFIPFLMPGIQGRLQKGMLTSVEPGVYIEGFGGIRIEDNVAVGEDGPIYLSTPQNPW